jgi:hypothetical protein
MDFLKKHTEELGKKRLNQMHTSGPYFPHQTQKTTALSRGKSQPKLPTEPIPDSTIHGPKALLLQSNRIPFEKWLTSESKRGKSVLDIAMQAKTMSGTKTSTKIPDSIQLSNSGSSNVEPDFEVPVRLAINSELIWRQLAGITGYNIDVDVKVMQEPWKLLVTYHEDIKKRLHELEMEIDELRGNFATGSGQGPVLSGNTLIEDEGKAEVYEGQFGYLQDMISHLRCLVDFINNDLKHVFELRKGLKDGTTREIAFKDLWHLFNPGDLLTTSEPPHERIAYKVFHTSGGVLSVPGDQTLPAYLVAPKSTHFEKVPMITPFRIDSYVINFDKSWIGPVHKVNFIPHYEGKRPVTALPVSYYDGPIMRRTASAFPIRFHEEPEIAMADLIKRGKRLFELTPFSHKRYCGPSSVADPEYVRDFLSIHA